MARTDPFSMNSPSPPKAASFQNHYMKSLLSLRLADAFALFVLLLALTARASEPNQLSDAEKQAGWRLLFDGQSTQGWRGYKLNAMPAKGWRVEDGLLKKVGGERGGDIITDEKFNDFDLTWEWR